MRSHNQSFDRNEPIVPRDPKVLPPTEAEDETAPHIPGEHAETKGERVHPPEQPGPVERSES